MKRVILILIILLIGVNTWADVVNIDKARVVAVNFYFERANSIKSISKDAVKITNEKVITNNNDIVYYIFNIGDNGFVIVSAESNVTPILAYSFEKNYPANTNVPALNWIINSYKNEITNSRTNNIQASDNIIRLWETYSSNYKSTTTVEQVLPMLGSINWDQSCYYNASCPADNDANYCNHNPTGCVATAMAQIMKYNAYPTQGAGTYSYNHYGAGYTNNYGTLSANFAATTYNWASMPYTVTSTNAAVATLMSQCGIAVGMSYDVNGSGAIVGTTSSNYQGPTAEKAFKNYFKYTSAIYHKKSSYTEAQWQALVLADVNYGRPILYAGDDGSAGHAFVLDGYQTSTSVYHYHFNFGWSGAGNGYFYIDTINPGTGGVGGGTYNFSTNEEGIFSLAKSTAGIESNNIPEVNIYPNPSNGYFTLDLSGLNASKIDLKVYNLVGEVVWDNFLNLKENTLNLDLSTLHKGIYILNINSGSNTFTKKITILK